MKRLFRWIKEYLHWRWCRWILDRRVVKEAFKELEQQLQKSLTEETSEKEKYSFPHWKMGLDGDFVLDHGPISDVFDEDTKKLSNSQLLFAHEALGYCVPREEFEKEFQNAILKHCRTLRNSSVDEPKEAEFLVQQSTVFVDEFGKKEYRKNGLLHREDGPAVEWPDGCSEWWINGERHREDGPAVERGVGKNDWWFLEGKILTQKEHAERIAKNKKETK